MKFFSIFILSLIFISCGASVAVDYDKEVDFNSYKLYNFYPSIQSGLSQIDEKRIIRIADSLLASKGFIKSETPQVFVNFYADETTSRSKNTVSIGVGGGGRNMGVGVSGGIPIGGKTINQQLTIDFVDSENDKLIWQAIAEGEYKERSTPEQKEAYYLSVIQKVLKKYPPKVK